MTALFLLITSGCTTSTNTVDITLPPKPERSEIGEVKTLSDFARVLNYYENLVEQWEAWGDAIDGILSDDVQNDTKKKKDKEVEKVAEIKNVRIAVSGTYEYAINELPNLCLPLPNAGAPDWVEQKELYKVYRPAHVLAGAVDMFASLPLTHNHPRLPVDGSNFRNLAVGWTGEKPWVDYLQESNEVGIRNTVVLYDDEALAAYERGEIQLSPGYNAIFEWQKGTAPDGTEYDIIMKEITGVNHLALLRLGRGGDSAKVLDGAPENNTNASKDHISKAENEAAKKRIFGKEFRGYEGKAAIEKLLEEKQGFVQGAFSRDDVGSIDVVYGEMVDPSKLKGYGLVKIFAKHPEITPEIITEVIKKGTKTDTYNGCNLMFNDYIVGLNRGYKENGKYVTTDNYIVTSFKKKEKVADTIAYAGSFTSDTIRAEDLFPDEIIIDTAQKVKTIFDIVRGSVFDRARAV